VRQGFGFKGQGIGRGFDKRKFYRFLFYFLILLFFFMIMSGGFFTRWQPFLIIPLAIAVSMFEREVGSALFGAFCGLMIDTVCGNLFGMSAIWLMPCALAASLLVMNLMRPNIINHLWMVTVTCIIMAFMEYFFKYAIWGEPNSDIILVMYIIPSYVSAIVMSPLVYLLTRAVSSKFREKDSEQLLDINGESNESS
jgi:rod shape-determining protein MreD